MQSGPTPPTKPQVKVLFKNQPLDKECVIPEVNIDRVIKKATKKTKEADFSKNGKIVEITDKNDKSIKWQIIVTKSNNKLSYFAIDLTKSAGKGAQGEVLLAQNLHTRSWAAVKIINPLSINADEDFAREKKNLARCNRLLGTAVDRKGIAYILMDFYSGITLEDYLFETDSNIPRDLPEHFKGKKPFDELLLARLVVKVLEQAIWLHKKQLAHRDFKLQNILLDDRGLFHHCFDVKVVDLGTAISFDPSKPEQATEIAGTFGYNDPYLTKRVNYGPRNDLYSLGVVIAAICSQNFYPAELRRKLLEQREAKAKSELTFEEVKCLMPDMFARSAPPPSSETAELKIRRNVHEKIKAIIDELTMEEPIHRPDLDKLIKLSSELNSLVTKATIETKVLNPFEAFEDYKAHRRMVCEAQDDSILNSPRGSTTNAVSPRASMPSSFLSKRRSVVIPHLNKFSFELADETLKEKEKEKEEEKVKVVPQQDAPQSRPKSARASMDSSARKLDRYPSGHKIKRESKLSPPGSTELTISPGIFDMAQATDRLTSLVSTLSVSDVAPALPTPLLTSPSGRLKHRRTKSSGPAFLSSLASPQTRNRGITVVSREESEERAEQEASRKSSSTTKP